MDDTKALSPRGKGGELTYDFYARSHNGKKRDFIFSSAKARKCDHPNLVITAMGASSYRCTVCNWFFDIVIANAQPMHLATVKAAYQLLHFGKEFGVAALQEVLRQPHGQSDGTPHKGVLPDGMTLKDAVMALETVDVTTPDGGKAQMKAVVESLWPSDVEIERRVKALKGSDAPGKQEYAAELEKQLEERHALGAGESGGRRALGERKRPRLKEPVSALPKAG